MTKVIVGASMSLDGYICGPDLGSFEQLFEWYAAGDVGIDTANEDITMSLTAPSAAEHQALQEELGALVVGRKLFDVTNGWGGRHPQGLPVVVLTHHPPPDPWLAFTFVTGGIRDAIDTAATLADGRAVGLNGGTIATQALNAGLVDEVGVDLVPYLLGSGRTLFDQLTGAPVRLGNPRITSADRVTHLRYPVIRAASQGAIR